MQGTKNEMIRVLELMPDWISALQKGEAVKVNFTLSVSFKLE